MTDSKQTSHSRVLSNYMEPLFHVIEVSDP